MTDNRRMEPRKNAFVFGTLQLDGRPSDLDCMVWDQSASGAMIEISGSAPVPDRFILMIGADGSSRPCRVVRRDGRRLGVVFE